MAAASRLAHALETVPPKYLWAALVSGRMQIIEPSEREYRRFRATPESADQHALWVTVRPRPKRELPRLLDANLLRAFLIGCQAKCLAFEEARTSCTISRRKSRCLRAMGFSGPPSRAPTLLALAAHSDHGSPRVPDASMEWVSDSVVLFTAPRIERALEPLLSGKVYGSLRLLMEGHSYAEIARSRRSRFCIINQLGAAYAELKATGRLAILAKLVNEPAFTSMVVPRLRKNESRRR